MKRIGILVGGLAATALMTALPALVYSAEAGRPPELVWNLTCKSCHESGAAPAILGMHLDAEQIKGIVRNGGLQMPPISDSQVSDAELDALADWVSAHDAPAQ